MISKNIYNLKKVCCEDISLIENYDKAIADTMQTWICHHRLEIQDNVVYSVKELKDLNMYYYRPASELIFLPKSEHTAMHNTALKTGKTTWNKGNHTACGWKHIKHHSEQGKLNISISLKEKGKQAWNKGGTPKYKWLTPTGEIRIMDICNARRYHPDWKLIEESF